MPQDRFMGNAASYSIINIGSLMVRRFESESPSSAPPLSIREDTEIMKITQKAQMKTVLNILNLYLISQNISAL